MKSITMLATDHLRRMFGLATLLLTILISFIDSLAQADFIMLNQNGGMPLVLDDDREVVIMPGQQNMMISDDDFFL